MTLNTNGLNSPIKRYRLVEWIRKQSQLNTVYNYGVTVFVWQMSFHKDESIIFKCFYVFGNMFVSLCVHISADGGDGQKTLNQSPWATITDSSESPDMGVGSQTYIFCMSGKNH